MYVVFDKNTSTGSMEPGLGGRGMSCPLSASTRSHLSQVRGSGLSLSRVWYRSKQMTTEVLSPVFPSHKPFVHRSYPWVSCLQHRGDELWCQRAQHLLPPGCQPLPGFWTALGAQLMLGIPGFQHHPKGFTAGLHLGSSLYILTPSTGILYQCTTSAHQRLHTGTEAESSPSQAALRTTLEPF